MSEASLEATQIDIRTLKVDLPGAFDTIERPVPGLVAVLRNLTLGPHRFLVANNRHLECTGSAIGQQEVGIGLTWQTARRRFVERGEFRTDCVSDEGADKPFRISLWAIATVHRTPSF